MIVSDVTIHASEDANSGIANRHPLNHSAPQQKSRGKTATS
ncbi:hypothetical protein VT84_34600 [Gemmata sp. SH-PL17]|nr:hypothetical protein VT84_34600 [Gemmata sp. SH-PL17]